MRDPGVGRVLVASLHQAIGEQLPTRLGFYESFLNPDALRGGTVGMAPLLAVVSFLRLEGSHYEPIVAAAGAYAAEWTVASMSPFERRAIRSSPAWLRTRLVLRLAGRLVADSADKSRTVWRVRQGTAHVELHGSVFCAVREPVASPLCGFYLAVHETLLKRFDLPVLPSVAQCRATGAGHQECLLTLAPASVVDTVDKESVA